MLVLNNRDLNQVTWEQRAMSGDPKFEGSQDLPDFPYARYAELLGLRGIRVDAPDQVGPAWDAALSSDRPVVLEAVTDPEVPPLPPHITIEQAKALASALIGWRSRTRGEIIGQSFKQKLQEFLPGDERDRGAEPRVRVERAGGRGLHRSHRRARGRRNAGLGLDHDRGRARLRWR